MNKLVHAITGNGTRRVRVRFNGHVCVEGFCGQNCSVVNFDEDFLDSTSDWVELDSEISDSPQLVDIYEFDWTSTLLSDWHVAQVSGSAATNDERPGDGRWSSISARRRTWHPDHGRGRSRSSCSRPWRSRTSRRSRRLCIRWSLWTRLRV